jgi:iron complex outermembrane receptor protein
LFIWAGAYPQRALGEEGEPPEPEVVLATRNAEKTPVAVGAGDELLLFEDMPVVVSAARRTQPLDWLSVPVSIITAEDIHYSGLTNIPEVLQFTPGMDVLSVDRNRYAVGVHGLHQVFADRTLALIDGRNAGDPIIGGADFLRWPVLMEDIKRIEVVRAPAGAVWGASALNGVINVITKDPEDCPGWLASTTWNHVGDAYNHLRWAETEGKWGWMLSSGYEHRRSSDRFLSGDHFDSEDHGRDWRFRGKAVYRPEDGAKLTFGLAHTHTERGDFEFGLFPPSGRERIDWTRGFARFEREFDNGSSGHLQWYGNFSNESRPSLFRADTAENDLEAQYNTTLGEAHHLTFGGNVRITRLRLSRNNAEQTEFLAGPFTECWAGAFVIDRWQVTERLALEGQFRADHYSGTGFDWSARATALYALDREKQHIVRVSGAKAYRAPLVFLREPQLLPTFAPPGELRNERSYSLEAGYRGRLTDWLDFRADGYVMRYQDLIGTKVLSTMPFLVITFDNNGDGIGYGGDAELTLRHKLGRLSAWYSFNDFAEQHGGQNVRSMLPARHKAGLTGRLDLPEDWTLTANYRFSSASPNDPSRAESFDPYHRLDLTVAKSVFDGRAELMLGLQDVFNQSEMTVKGESDFTGHETPGRTFFVRFQVEW